MAKHPCRVCRIESGVLFAHHMVTLWSSASWTIQVCAEIGLSNRNPPSFQLAACSWEGIRGYRELGNNIESTLLLLPVTKNNAMTTPKIIFGLRVARICVLDCSIPPHVHIRGDIIHRIFIYPQLRGRGVAHPPPKYFSAGDRISLKESWDKVGLWLKTTNHG